LVHALANLGSAPEEEYLRLLFSVDDASDDDPTNVLWQLVNAEDLERAVTALNEHVAPVVMIRACADATEESIALRVVCRALDAIAKVESDHSRRLCHALMAGTLQLPERSAAQLLVQLGITLPLQKLDEIYETMIPDVLTRHEHARVFETPRHNRSRASIALSTPPAGRTRTDYLERRIEQRFTPGPEMTLAQLLASEWSGSFSDLTTTVAALSTSFASAGESS
jgi:hypothetical protein